MQRRHWAKTTGTDGTVRVTVPVAYQDRPQESPTDSPKDNPAAIYTRKFIEGLQAPTAAETRGAEKAERERDHWRSLSEATQRQIEQAHRQVTDQRPKRRGFPGLWRAP